MKHIKFSLLFILGMQSMMIEAAQESKQNYEQERQQVIDKAIIDFPHLVEGFDIIQEKYSPPVPKFHDFLQENLAQEGQESNFGELLCHAIDLVIKNIEQSFLEKINDAISNNIQSLDQIQDPIFMYGMKYKDNINIKHTLKKCLEKRFADKGTLLHKAIRVKNERLFNELLTFDIDVNSCIYKPSLLTMACTYRCVNIVQALLQAGAHVNTDESPLFIAVRNSATCLGGTAPNYTRVACESSEKITSLLLDAGADVNMREDDTGCYILAVAISGHNRKVVRMILSIPGINLNERIWCGGTALHQAVWHDNRAVVAMLLDKGIDLSIEDNHGRTAEDIEIQYSFAQTPMRRLQRSCCVIA